VRFGSYIGKYEVTWSASGPVHVWSLAGFHGGVHLHIHGYRTSPDEEYRWSGGVEAHRKSPPDYSEPPSHADCWLTGGLCWHDGTSLWATEHWIPRFLRGEEPEKILQSLVVWADEQLLPADNDAE